MSTSTSTSLLSNKTYDYLKRLVTLALPAAGALYFALAQIWGFPNGEEVVGSIAAVNVFLGVVLGVSSKTYDPADGTVDVTMDPESQTKSFLLNLDTSPDALDTKPFITFRVNRT